MNRWALIVLTLLIGGCGKSGPTSGDYQAELAALDRLEKDLEQAEQNYQAGQDALDRELASIEEDCNRLEQATGEINPEIRRKLQEARHRKIDASFAAAKEFDALKGPFVERIQKQRDRISEIERKLHKDN